MKTLLLFLIIFSCNQALFSQSSALSQNIAEVNDSDSLTLPVELIYFYAEILANSVLLKWGTATEVNNFGFNIERSDHPIGNWETIDFVLGSGNSNIPIDYEYEDTTVSMTGIVYYRLKQIDITGTFEYSDTVTVNFITSVEQIEDIIPESFSLSQNYPNPFNPVTTIEFDVSSPGNIELLIYDNLGNYVVTLVDDHLLSGRYSVNFDASTFSSGVYFYRLTSQDFTATKKLILLK